ncbi:hypothetical protein [Chroococcidiopsis sp. SAG 2025]|uniref:hypothetical protein n=1 Tax=Chroococcidiopsis sp. SAG 2025 TaxID=171389 RepID=UPI002936EADA|nr:hypothetical protein [Chroococcidiopsis sp. SAG 2025]
MYGRVLTPRFTVLIVNLSAKPAPTITDNRTIKDFPKLHTVQFAAFELGQLRIAIAVLVCKLLFLIER